jgi:hypothetical protein
VIGASDLSTSLSFEGSEICKICENFLELDATIPVLAAIASS